MGKKVTLGRTGIVSEKNAFGALPIQRVPMDTAVPILQKAYRAGITFFDTARSYTDSEEKLGAALSGVRKDIILATKTGAKTPEEMRKHLETSLSLLKTDYIDVYQLHNPKFCPRPGDGTGMYEFMLDARDAGKIRFIGITNHRLDVAEQAVASGLYDTLQFPFSYLASDRDIALVRLCEEMNVGFIAMKALSGGLITNAAAAYAWMAQYGGVLPIWGVQRESELDEFISFIDSPPALTDEFSAVIARDRDELTGEFCRGCGYCMPGCPAEIQIGTCARMSQFIRRSPSVSWSGESSREMMRKTEECTECGQCAEKCPYGLNPPDLLKRHYADYKEYLAGFAK
ncbi:MAG: aldo/keto reductase [Oscillospiraceae bacterium]|nr:aldo/keto reductase [Oscillospiraceae bacterium]